MHYIGGWVGELARPLWHPFSKQKRMSLGLGRKPQRGKTGKNDKKYYVFFHEKKAKIQSWEAKKGKKTEAGRFSRAQGGWGPHGFGPGRLGLGPTGQDQASVV